MLLCKLKDIYGFYVDHAGRQVSKSKHEAPILDYDNLEHNIAKSVMKGEYFVEWERK